MNITNVPLITFMIIVINVNFKKNEKFISFIWRQMMDFDAVAFTAVLSYIKRVRTTDTTAPTIIALPAKYYVRQIKIAMALIVMVTMAVFGGKQVSVGLQNINQEMTRITELA